MTNEGLTGIFGRTNHRMLCSDVRGYHSFVIYELAEPRFSITLRPTAQLLSLVMIGAERFHVAAFVHYHSQIAVPGYPRCGRLHIR